MQLLILLIIITKVEVTQKLLVFYLRLNAKSQGLVCFIQLKRRFVTIHNPVSLAINNFTSNGLGQAPAWSSLLLFPLACNMPLLPANDICHRPFSVCIEYQIPIVSDAWCNKSRQLLCYNLMLMKYCSTIAR